MRLPDGVTNRQLHHWRTSGKIFPPEDPRTSPGRGHHIKDDDDGFYQRKLNFLAYLYNHGLGIDLASRVAQEAAKFSAEDSITVTAYIAPGVTLNIAPGVLDGSGD